VDRSIDSPEPFVQTNVVGTLRLLTPSAATGPAGRLQEGWLSFSCTFPPTRSMHARPAGSGIHRGDPFAPNSPYAASRPAATIWCGPSIIRMGLPTLTTNCSNNYGPYHFPEKLIP